MGQMYGWEYGKEPTQKQEGDDVEITEKNPKRNETHTAPVVLVTGEAFHFTDRIGTLGYVILGMSAVTRLI